MLRNILVTIVFGAAALVGIWDLLQIEAFDNAVMQFMTAGVVPGTRVVLTPGQVYLVLCGLLLGVMCLLFRKGLVREIREYNRAFQRSNKPPERPPIIIRVPRQPGRLVVWARAAAHAIAAWYRPATVRAGRYIATRSRQDTRQLAAFLHTLGRRVWRVAVRAWRRTEPRIRQADAYIEQALKRNARTAAMLHQAAQVHQEIQARIAAWRAKAQHPVEK